MAGGLVRRAVKGAAAGVLHYSGLRSAMAAWRRHQSGGRRILIVSYHRVVDDFAHELKRSIPGLLIAQRTFRHHLEAAARAGYDFASLGDALDVMAGRRTAKKDLLVVTFDDGYRDVYRYAYPVMKQMGVPATTYLPTDFIGTERRFNHDRLFHLVHLAAREPALLRFAALPPVAAALLTPIVEGRKTPSAALDDFIGEHAAGELLQVIATLEALLAPTGKPLTPPQGDVMDWDEVRTMVRDGFEFGGHTRGHTVLTLEPQAVVEQEVAESKRIIERETGRPVVDFAYCNGWYSEELIRVLKAHGFRSGVTTEDYPNVIGGDPFTLKRKVLWENFSVGLLGERSASLTSCQLDDCFGLLGMSHPVPGRRTQAFAPWAAGVNTVAAVGTPASPEGTP